MIITKFMKQNIRQIIKAHLNASDKIENLREILEPYNLQDDLSGIYTPRQILDNFNLNKFSGGLNDTIKKLAGNHQFLASKHYFRVNTSSYTIKKVNDTDVKNVAHQVEKLLKHDDE